MNYEIKSKIVWRASLIIYILLVSLAVGGGVLLGSAIGADKAINKEINTYIYN